MKPVYTTITLARGFTVFFMPAIHTVMWFSQPEMYTRWWIYGLRFIAEGPGAQLFMFIMGFLLAAGKPKPASEIIRRSLLLLLSGYVLNLVRIYLPARLGLLPPEMLSYYRAGQGAYPYLPLLFTGDILQFAGLAYGFTGLLGKLPGAIWYCLGCYLLATFAGPFCWGLRSDDPMLDHWLALLCAADHRAFFPLLPWLCYPIAGWLCATWGKAKFIEKKYLWLLRDGLILFVAGTGIHYLVPISIEGDFYRGGPGETIAITGLVMSWLFVFYCLVKRFSEKNPFVRLLNFCGRRINAIYWFHWVLIGWIIGPVGYHHLNELQSWIAMFLISTISFIIPFIFFRLRATRPAQL